MRLSELDHYTRTLLETERYRDYSPNGLQVQGRADGRQVEGARVGLSINQGLFGHGSCVIVTR